MKHIYSSIYKIFAIVLLSAFLVPVTNAFADEGMNTVLIMGQVKTATDGYPVIGHKVYISNDSLGVNNFQYFKELTTNLDGYYYDTISTDFNSGSFLIYTFDPENYKLDTTVFFRFSEIHNDNIFVVNFSLFKDATDNSLQASFEYKPIEGEEKYSYNFIDKTNCEEIVKWRWAFGDGAISSQQNPSHIFPGPGLYTISLTVTGYVEEQLEENTAYQYLFIPEFNYYHMGGHCFASLFPIDKGLAYIYRIDGEEIIKYDTMKIDTLGYYYFYHVAEGEYYIKLQPTNQSIVYGVMFPTYFGDEVFWEDATVINHNSNIYEYDVNLIEGMGMPSGEGVISGVVTDEVSGKFLESDNTKGVDVYLLNENGLSLTSRYTDNNSAFEFGNIPLDTYYLVPEITGVPQVKTKITLNEDTPERDEISINIETGEVILGADDIFLSDASFGLPYPNPANDQVQMKISLENTQDAFVKVYDLSGRLLVSKTEKLNQGIHNVSLQTSGLENGIYVLRVELSNEVNDQKFVINR